MVERGVLICFAEKPILSRSCFPFSTLGEVHKRGSTQAVSCFFCYYSHRGAGGVEHRWCREEREKEGGEAYKSSLAIASPTSSALPLARRPKTRLNKGPVNLPWVVAQLRT